MILKAQNKEFVLRRKDFAKVGVFFFLLYAFFESTRNLVFGSEKIAMAVLIIPLFLFCICIRPVKLTKWDLLWLLMLILLLFRNYDLKNKDYFSFLETFVCFSVVLVASHTVDWDGAFLGTCRILGWIHVILGFAFYVFQDVYLQQIVPLLKLDDYWTFRINEMIDSGYMVGFTTHYSTLGIYLAILLLLLFSDLLNASKSKKRTIISIVIVCFAFLLNQKRGPFILSLFSVLIVYFLCYFRGKRSTVTKVLLGGFAAMVAFLVAVNTVPVVQEFMSRFQSDLTFDEFTSGRLYDLWQPAILLFTANPIFGIGWRGFKYTFHIYSDMVQYNDAHNIYLQLLCEVGVVGFVIAVFIFISTYIKSLGITRKYVDKANLLKNNKISKTLCFSVLIQTFFLLEGLVGNTLYGLTLFPYVLSIAYIYSILNGTKRVA